MNCFYDHQKQVAIWWSPKCGCTTIKSLYFNYIRKRNIEYVHLDESDQFDDACFDYRNVLTIRNPYDRIVSFFLHKYVRSLTTEYLDLLSQTNFSLENLTFETYLQRLHQSFITQPFSLPELEHYHTTPQFSETYLKLSNSCKEHSIPVSFFSIHFLESFDAIKFVESLGYSNQILNPDNSIDLNQFFRNIPHFIQSIEVPNAEKINYKQLKADFSDKRI